MTDANFWENRWKTGQTGWDLGAPSPPLIQYAEQIPAEKRQLRILIPGCGNGYEAIWLLENGFPNLTLLDIAPTAVEYARRRINERVPERRRQQFRVISGDFFELDQRFDLILEQTFFCALDPVLRPAYAARMHQLLAPGGKLAGVLFNRDFEGGPPFGGHESEYRKLFEPLFRIHTLAPCTNSIAPRAGAEVFFILEKKA